MSKASQGRSSAQAWDGALIFVVPNPTEITLSSAQTDVDPFVCPCDGEIVQATARLMITPGTAAATITVGDQSSDTKFGEHTFALAAAAVEYNILPSLTGSTSVKKGDRIVFGGDGAATSTCLANGCLVIAPNAV